MKKINKGLSLAVFLLVCMVGLTACSWSRETTYKAETQFMFSNDQGHSYGNGKIEYAVGETVYMKVRLGVASSKDNVPQVKAVLTIPNIETVDAKYIRGQVITPVPDPVKNVTTYELTVNASKKPVPVECVIQFKPNSVGDVGMTLVYDDYVDSSYDLLNTLVFVESVSGE